MNHDHESLDAAMALCMLIAVIILGGGIAKLACTADAKDCQLDPRFGQLCLKPGTFIPDADTNWWKVAPMNTLTICTGSGDTAMRLTPTNITVYTESGNVTIDRVKGKVAHDKGVCWDSAASNFWHAVVSVEKSYPYECAKCKAGGK